jgi:hypothetical protein
LNFGRFPAGKTTGKTNQATERGSTYAGITLVLNGARDQGCVMPQAGFEQLTVYRMPVVQFSGRTYESSETRDQRT